MAIFEPVPEFTRKERRLVELLSRLLRDHLAAKSLRTNEGDAVVISEAEASELIQLLSDLLASKKFLEVSTFVQGLSLRKGVGIEGVKEIYLAARKRNGRSRAMSSLHWGQFQHRLGNARGPGWGSGATRMSFAYFESMERKLLRAVGLRDRVLQFVLDVLKSQEGRVEDIRNGQIDLRTGAVREVLQEPLSLLSVRKLREIPSQKVAAAIGLVADTSVIFTTRDWGVAGTISAMASAASIVIY